MRSLYALPFKKFIKRPARSVALAVIAAFLTLSAFGGTVVVMSLSRGIDSLSARLGADIIVTPYAASSQVSYDSIILQGKPGQFYMDAKYYEEIQNEIEGIDKITAQFYLASAKASCCSSRLQIIGFDPATDFSVQPWVAKSYADTLGLYDAVAGSDVTPDTDRTITIFGETLHVRASLEKTGTELDSAVYVNIDTVKALLRAHNVKNPNQEKTVDPDRVVSSVLIKVADGYDIDSVTGDINNHVRQVKAVRTQNMISGVADSLSGVSAVVSALMLAVWMLAAVLMAVVFTMMMHERKKEFAVLRVIGASRARLAGMVFEEAALLSLTGGAAGAAVTVLLTALFAPTLERAVGLPFLLPSAAVMAVTGGITVLVTVLIGAAAASVSAVKISRQDTGTILRGDA